MIVPVHISFSDGFALKSRTESRMSQWTMRKNRQSFQLTYLDGAGESPRRQPPKDGIHSEKVPGENDNPHFVCPSSPSESMEKHWKGDWVLARVKEAHGRQNKKGGNGQRTKINCVQQFLFHCEVVDFVPSSVRSIRRSEESRPSCNTCEDGRREKGRRRVGGGETR